MILETQRLMLREMTPDNLSALREILQDDAVMYAYEGAFSDEETMRWLERQIARYREDGFGLWAVVLKETGVMIGQCGLTMQEYNGGRVIEVGYLFQKTYWHRGYAAEAAIACREYAFNTLHAKEVYSIIRDTNTASQNVAKRNGMVRVGSFVKHYRSIDMPHDVYCIRQPNRP